MTLLGLQKEGELYGAEGLCFAGPIVLPPPIDR